MVLGSWPLALPTLCSTHCSPMNAILPNPRTLDGYTLHQSWSANLVLLILINP